LKTTPSLLIEIRLFSIFFEVNENKLYKYAKCFFSFYFAIFKKHVTF